MVPLPPLRDGGCALPICPFGRACLPLISDADCTRSPGRLWFLGDGHERTVSLRRGNFNPRAPCGARHVDGNSHRFTLWISIHAPVWGATGGMGRTGRPDAISIHAPRVGRDDNADDLTAVVPISIHAPWGRGGVSAGRPAGRSLCRTGSSCAYRARSDCRSGTICRGSTGCRCSWTCPTDRTRRRKTGGHTCVRVDALPVKGFVGLSITPAVASVGTSAVVMNSSENEKPLALKSLTISRGKKNSVSVPSSRM